MTAPPFPHFRQLLRRPGRRPFSGLGDNHVQLLPRVKLRDRQLPQVLVQIPRPVLPLVHQRLHRRIKRIAVDDAQQIVGLVGVLAGNPIKPFIHQGRVIGQQGRRRLAASRIDHSQRTLIVGALPVQLRRQFVEVVYLSQQVQLVDRGLVFLPPAVDGLPAPPHPPGQPAQSDAAGAVLVRRNSVLPPPQRQQGFQRRQGHIGGYRLAQVNLKEMSILDGLPGNGRQVQIAPGRFVQNSPAGVDGYRPAGRNNRRICRFPHKEKTARQKGRPLPGITVVGRKSAAGSIDNAAQLPAIRLQAGRPLPHLYRPGQRFGNAAAAGAAGKNYAGRHREKGVGIQPFQVPRPPVVKLHGQGKFGNPFPAPARRRRLP